MRLDKPGESRGLTGTGMGFACQVALGRVVDWVWNQTKPFFRSKPGPLAGYPDPLLTLVADGGYLKTGCLVLQDFLFFSLYSFSGIAKQARC